MTILDRIINALIKFVFIILTLSIAVVPLIYIFGNERVYPQGWQESFQQLSGWQQLHKIKQHRVSNIYLLNNKAKATWKNINSTLNLANYIQYQLQKQEITVVKRIVPFHKPSNSPKDKINMEILQQTQIIENPPLQWLKNIIEPYIKFEHQSAKYKHWVIISLGDLENKFINQIETIQKDNPLYKFIIMSLWPITNKLIDAYQIPYQNYSINSQTSQKVNAEPQPLPSSNKQKKGKNEKKYKVKQVKEEKLESKTKANNTSSQL